MYKAGYIQKRGSNSKNWKTRWMATEKDGLAYYKKEYKDRIGHIDLHQVTDVSTDTTKKKNIIKIISKERTWIFACISPQDRDQWREVILAKRSSLGSVDLGQLPNSPRDNNIVDKESTLSESRGIVKKSSSRRLINKEVLERNISKYKVKLQGNIKTLPIIGKLYVSVEEANFFEESSKQEQNACPVVSAYFERQYITSTPSNNPANPRWKDIFLFQVISMESRLKLKILNSTTNTIMGATKIPIKENVADRDYKQFHDLTVKDDKKSKVTVGRVLISWRLEPTKAKETDEIDIYKERDNRIGTFHIIVIEARDLKPRKTGIPHNAFLQLTYNKQELSSPSVEGKQPKWDYGAIFRVSKDTGLMPCIISVLDMDKIHRTHLGTVVVSQAMLDASVSNEIEQWLPLQLGDDNPEVNEVQGELHIRYRYKLVQDEVTIVALEMPDQDVEEDDEEYSEKSCPMTARSSTSTNDWDLHNTNNGRMTTGENSRSQKRSAMSEILVGPFSPDTAVSLSTEIYDSLYKIIIIGNSGVGKTNLLGRWLDNKFSDCSATINVEFAAKLFNIDGKIIKVQLWDTAGQEQFRALTRSYYRKSAGAIIVYDVTDPQSFENVEGWLADIKDAPGNEETQVMLVGNKTDLKFARKVTTQEGTDLAAKERINFLETSALNGNNVQRAFQIVLQDIHKLNQKKLDADQTAVNVTVDTIVLDNQGANQEFACCVSGGESNFSFSTVSSFFSSL